MAPTDPGLVPPSAAQGMAAYLRSFVYGGLDGAITTLAVVSGSSGAALGTHVILILGFANLFADGLSMGASNYLGIKSEAEQHGQDVQAARPLRHGAATFGAFVLAGLVPLLAYLLPLPGAIDRFPLAVALTAVTLFAMGAARSRFLPRSTWRLGLEMLLVGGLAAVVAYAVGAVAEGIVAGL